MTQQVSRHDRDVPSLGGAATPAADSDALKRPGVPMEVQPDHPHPTQALHATAPQALGDTEVLLAKGKTGMTHVHATVLPPRGVSGALRRLAFQAPEHLTRHWLLLLVADRVDVVESRLRRGPTALLVGGLATLAGGLALSGGLGRGK
jgi:hypothetical protein